MLTIDQSASSLSSQAATSLSSQHDAKTVSPTEVGSKGLALALLLSGTEGCCVAKFLEDIFLETPLHIKELPFHADTILLPISLHQEALQQTKGELKKYCQGKSIAYKAFFGEIIEHNYYNIKVIITDALQRFSPYLRVDAIPKLTESRARKKSHIVGRMFKYALTKAFKAALQASDILSRDKYKISFKYWSIPYADIAKDYDEEALIQPRAHEILRDYFIEQSVNTYIVNKYPDNKMTPTKVKEKNEAVALSNKLVKEECDVLLEWIEAAAKAGKSLDIGYLGMPNKAILYISKNFRHFLQVNDCVVRMVAFNANYSLFPAFKNSKSKSEFKLDDIQKTRQVVLKNQLSFTTPQNFGQDFYLTLWNRFGMFDQMADSFQLYNRNDDTLYRLHTVYYQHLKYFFTDPDFTPAFIASYKNIRKWNPKIVLKAPEKAEMQHGVFYFLFDAKESEVIKRNGDIEIRRRKLSDIPELKDLKLTGQESFDETNLRKNFLVKLCDYFAAEQIVNTNLCIGIVLESLAVAALNNGALESISFTCYNEAANRIQVALKEVYSRKVNALIPQIILNYFTIVSHWKYWILFYVKSLKNAPEINFSNIVQQLKNDLKSLKDIVEGGISSQNKIRPVEIKGISQLKETSAYKSFYRLKAEYLILCLILLYFQNKDSKIKGEDKIKVRKTFDQCFKDASEFIKITNSIVRPAWSQSYVVMDFILLHQIRAWFYSKREISKDEEKEVAKLHKDIAENIVKIFVSKTQLESFCGLVLIGDRVKIEQGHLQTMKKWYQHFGYTEGNVDRKILNLLEENFKELGELYGVQSEAEEDLGVKAVVSGKSSLLSSRAFPIEEKVFLITQDFLHKKVKS